MKKAGLKQRTRKGQTQQAQDDGSSSITNPMGGSNGNGGERIFGRRSGGANSMENDFNYGNSPGGMNGNMNGGMNRPIGNSDMGGNYEYYQGRPQHQQHQQLHQHPQQQHPHQGQGQYPPQQQQGQYPHQGQGGQYSYPQHPGQGPMGQNGPMGGPVNGGGGGGGMGGPPNGPMGGQGQMGQMGRRRPGNNANVNMTDDMALNQKNHRLAKELSDLRVRHREETKVVSRLTMENMNLASRCREAISQVAALKKEIVMYQKKQGEYQLQIQQLQQQCQQQAQAKQETKSKSKHKKALSKEHIQNIAGGGESPGNDLESKRSGSPTTDLDRIMTQQMKKDAMKKTAEGNTVKSSSDADLMVTKKLQELNVSSSSQSSSSNADGSSNKPSGTTVSSSSKRPSNQGSTTTSSTKPNNADNLATSNSKIPISVTSTSSNQKDDEFDADIDMVDFFAKSQAALSSPPGESLTGSTGRTHVRKQKDTDDHMPVDVVSPPSFSPGENQRKGDNLLSSLDAFEASFASAFPETSFSLSSETPSSASMDMAFDVPDFEDPFFKTSSSSNSHNNNSSTSSTGNSGGQSKNGLKSQLQNLFPESAMNFKTSPMQNPVFDSPMAFSPMDMSRDGTTKGNAGQLLSKDEKASQKRHVHNRSAAAPLSPSSMSAEMQQLDSIANLASTGEKPDASGSGPSASAASRARKTRSVKQPVSYAEPSLNSKLRRGDVIFPKVDPEKKIQQSNGSAAGAKGSNPKSTMDGKNPEEVLKDLEQSSARNLVQQPQPSAAAATTSS